VLRILLAFEKKHTTHMDSVRLAISRCCPDAQVMVTVPEELEGKIDRFNPHLLVCEPPVPTNPAKKLPATIEFSIEPRQPSRFSVGQQRWELQNPGLGELQATIVDIEKRILSAS
jgi:hypothetical protein